VGFVLIAAASFFLARHWQSRQPVYDRVAAVEGCDLHAGPCRQTVAGGVVVLSIMPQPVPLMRPLQLAVEVVGLDARGVAVEIRGLNMDMGLNRTLLAKSHSGRWKGETILPLCSQRLMEWEAGVRLETEQGRFEVPFLFDTRRP
jgi:hypothetical protein